MEALLNTGAMCGRIYKWLDGSISANPLDETGRFVKTLTYYTLSGEHIHKLLKFQLKTILHSKIELEFRDFSNSS